MSSTGKRSLRKLSNGQRRIEVLSTEELREFLNEKSLLYNNPQFIELDPIQIPHMYSEKEDVEIAGLLTAAISWGNRKAIIKGAHRMMDLMGNVPYEFIMNYSKKDLDHLSTFVYRTFNGIDFTYFIQALAYIYRERGGLEHIFTSHQTESSLQPAIHQLKKEFFSIPHPRRTEKHLPDPQKGSAAKRVNMYLRWMVRDDKCGVDFGLWKEISPSKLSCPLDVHTGNVARKLGLVQRRQNDARTVSQLDDKLRSLDPLDPVKYDFALFGLGIFEHF